MSLEDIHAASHYDRGSLQRIENIVDAEETRFAPMVCPPTAGHGALKKMGFSDERLAELGRRQPTELRHAAHVRCPAGL